MSILDRFSLKNRIALVTAGSGTSVWEQRHRGFG